MKISCQLFLQFILIVAIKQINVFALPQVLFESKYNEKAGDLSENHKDHNNFTQIKNGSKSPDEISDFGQNTTQDVFSGKIFSTNFTEYNSTQSTSLKQFLWPPELPNRIQDNNASPNVKPTKQPVNTNPSISLEYEPILPSFHPNPGNNVGQIVPPGKPWPANVEDYVGFSQTSSRPSVSNQNKETPELPNRIQDIEPSKKPTEQTVNSPISLEYKPILPSFHPNPGNNVGQIVPPGKPWPANAEDYVGFSPTTTKPIQTINQKSPELTNRFQDVIISQRVVNPSIVLGYKPIRPSYKPNPGNNIAQIVPPGKPWPASLEEYDDFVSQINLSNRYYGIMSQSIPTVLGYNPTFPFYHLGNEDEIIQPEKMWSVNNDFAQIAAKSPNRFEEIVIVYPTKLVLVHFPETFQSEIDN